MNKWKHTGKNWVLNRESYYISYNPNTSSTIEGKIFNELGESFGIGRKSKEETALVLIIKGSNRIFKILNGDFRKDYEQCKNLAECLSFYYSKKKEFGSDWSTRRLK